MDDQKTLTQKTWDFSDLVMRAAGTHLFTTAMVGDENGQVLQVQSGWAGGMPAYASRGPYFGPKKADDLLSGIALPGALLNEVVLGPVLDLPHSTKYRGGVRFPASEFEGGKREFNITSGSGDNEDFDLLIAVLMNWVMLRPTRFHHVGFRHPTMKSMMDAASAEVDRLHVQPTYFHSDHERFYFKVEASTATYGYYWIEHQFFPNGNQNFGVHIDVATDSPYTFLAFLEHHLKVQKMTWDAGDNDPVGKVGVLNRAGIEFAIMARQNWWEIPQE